jgi:hypothetical protein
LFKAQVPRVGGRGITLEVLRTKGADALSTSGIKGLISARLTEIQLTYENTFHEVKVLSAEDLFGALHQKKPDILPLPKTGDITAVAFQLQFDDAPDPITVRLQLPNVSVFSDDGHANQIRQWLASSHFIQPPRPDQAAVQTSLCKTPGAHSKSFPA